MRRIFTLLVFFWTTQCFAYAAAPTVPGSNLTFNSLDGGGFSGSFTVGNGTTRIVVMKEGSAVQGMPVNGVDYVANQNFGTAGSEFSLPGEYVVSRATWNTFTVKNLKPGTVYYVAVFDFNGTGTTTQYLLTPLTGNQATLTAPVTQTSAMAVTATTGNTISLGWTKGSGSGRIIIARKGSPVNVTPADLSDYYQDQNFGVGAKIGTDNYVVYKNPGTSVVIKSLEPNTTYYFSFFEYNGSTSPVYLTPGATLSVTTNAGPTAAATAPGFSALEGNRLTFGVSVGNGTGRLFIVKKESPVTAVPVNGVAYAANAAFGTAGTEIAAGEYVVATTGSSVIVTNLEANTTYHFRVYEYDVDKAGYTYYLTSSYAVKSGTAATTPTTVATGLNVVSLTGSSATIGFVPGNGVYRTVIMKAGGPVDAIPADLARYTGNNTFGSGQQITPGNYCIYGGMNGNQFSVSGLVPGTTYYVSIFEYNGNYYPVYAAAGATMSFTVPLEPGTISKTPFIVLAEGKSFRLGWTNGDGGKRLVVAKKGSPVTAKPADMVSYTANTGFGLGEELATGEFVVYDGTTNYVDLKNLEIGTTYHFAVFEYNTGADGKPDYLTSSWLATTGATVSAPATQTAITSISGLQSAQATINFTKGNGANRIFVMKQGAPVNIDPVDATKYNYNATFGSAGSLISDGNYVVQLTSGSASFSVYGLQPNTTYYVSAWEFNGSTEPVYLHTAPATYSFTTPDVVGATVPTTAAASPLVENVDGNKFTLKWTNGNGEKRIVVMRQGAAVSFVPAAGTAYTANAAMGSGTDLGGGQYVVYNNNGSSVDITNLAGSSTYYFTVYEYNGTGSLIRYLTSAVLASTAATVMAPSTPAGSVTVTKGTGSITFSWINGNGSGRLVVMKEGSGVSATPADLSAYPANTVFGSGSQVAVGEYVVYAGNGNGVTVTGFSANKTYNYAVFEYNGIAAPVYNKIAFPAGTVVMSSTLPIELLYFKARAAEDNILLTWATTQEVNNKLFTIERSYNGVYFEAIKAIPGAGNSSHTISYSYTDKPINTGKVYYRLKQTDMDGRFTISNIVTVDLQQAQAGISAYPNPVQNQVKLILPATVKEGMLFIFDAKGLLSRQQKIVAGQYITMTGLKAGTYYLNLQAGGKQYHTTIVKQ